MSRTKKKGKKGAGFEYWGKRAGTLKSWTFGAGKKAKKVTHRAERNESKRITRKEMKENE
jgi:hypothetical protein